MTHTTTTADAPSAPALQMDIRENDSSVTVYLRGELTRHTVADAYRSVDSIFRGKRPVVLDMGGVSFIDSAGLALVASGMRKMGSGPEGLSLSRVEGEVANALKLAGWTFSDKQDSLDITGKVRLPEAIGAGADSAYESAYYYMHLVTETLYHSLISPFFGEKLRIRIFFEQMARLGSGSAPIVWLIALLVGLTTAYQAAYELRRFGANIYLADLVSISMMTELGPLMAAIIVAGRSGAAITAEIGTMRVNEEIDALTLIGINPIQYLVVPRATAVVIAQAFLGITAAVVGIFGGFIIAVVSLELSPAAFLNQSTEALVLKDVINNLTKSGIFGFIIVTVGAFYGMRVSGGAAGVGKATTNSVVSSIFLIIVADCIYSLI